jgi:hypothetical protein
MSIKEIFELIKIYFNLVWSKKVWIIICGFSLAIILGIRAYQQPDTYRAKLTFMVNEDEGSINGVGAILGEFGFGGSNQGKNYDKITEIARSNKILKQVLLDSVEIQGQEDLIANHIINIYDYHKYWNEDTILNDFFFSPNNQNVRKTNIATKILISFLRDNPSDPKSKSLLSIDYDDESTIISINGSTESPELSLVISKSWYDKISKFYIKKSTERQQKTLDQLIAKSDSIYTLLVGAETGLAKGTDKMGLIKSIDNLPTARQSRNMQMYSAMFAEVVKNKETADFILRNKTPYFQTIDLPILPLKKALKRGWLMWSLIGGFLGGLICVSIIISFDYIKKELND